MILWFRNDLRTHDNPALQYYLSHKRLSGTGKAIFFVCEQQWLIHDWSARQIDFIKRHAAALVDELALLGVELSIVEVNNFEEQAHYLKVYCEKHNIKEVVANSEVEFNERQRDINIQASGINLTLFESDVIVPKGKVLTKSDTMYKVFTPFKRAWLAYVKQFGFEYLGKPALVSTNNSINNVKKVSDDEKNSLTSAWPLSTEYEKEALPRFLQEKLLDYQEYRDIPSIKGTSGISPYLAAGAISPRYILRLLINQQPDVLISPDSKSFSWLNELIWREFYRHLLYHEPRLCKHQAFNRNYNNMPWHNDMVLFEAWKQGKTGYPIVDAAMRQLNHTGWMHNRLRMVVASFLTKHLLIDWRWGEQYFMQQLIDGDLAANNGGWQWAASTGCDAQPYFRVFNPIRQSERFDPNGEFIRTYLPELVNVPDKFIHFPHVYLAKENLSTYWPAIVEHKFARQRAIAFFKH